MKNLNSLYVVVPSRAPLLTSVKVLISTSVELEWQPVLETLTDVISTKYAILNTAEKKKSAHKGSTCIASERGRKWTQSVYNIHFESGPRR